MLIMLIQKKLRENEQDKNGATFWKQGLQLCTEPAAEENGLELDLRSTLTASGPESALAVQSMLT